MYLHLTPMAWSLRLPRNVLLAFVFDIRALYRPPCGDRSTRAFLAERDRDSDENCQRENAVCRLPSALLFAVYRQGSTLRETVSDSRMGAVHAVGRGSVPKITTSAKIRKRPDSNGLEGYTTQHGGSCGLAGPGNRYGTQRRIAE
ncbi:MAG: hypothetical protein R6U98_10255, partial [Pirellulaceae bacterium]